MRDQDSRPVMAARPAPVTRVIGIGAEDRGDDAAGVLVARLLRASAPPGIEIHESVGDPGGLLELLAGAERVILVDAARGAGAPGTVRCLGHEVSLHRSSRSTHGLGLAEAMGVAAALGILPATVRLYVVHGRSFELGPITTEVVAGVRAAAELILRDELGPVRRPSHRG